MRLQVRSRVDHGLEHRLQQQFARHAPLDAVRASRVFWLAERQRGALSRIPNLQGIFHDPVSEEIGAGVPLVQAAHTYVEVRVRPGVTDNLARTATEAMMIVSGVADTSGWMDWDVTVISGWQLELAGSFTSGQVLQVVYQHLANPLLHEVQVGSGAELAESGWFKGTAPDTLPVRAPDAERELKLFALDFDVLQRVSAKRGLALSPAEIRTILAHFASLGRQRWLLGWEGMITEVELECIAQTWSEHCKHKIFASQIAYSEEPGCTPPLDAGRIDSLYRTYIQAPTREMTDCGYLVSVFSDNAGIVDFDERINVCVKVETHNSPSALDPYGGAITGILGVNRDIIGCGLGARPIANLDVFCLSTSDLFPDADDPARPLLLKDPAVIFRGVHKGVEDGGNQSGIPTVNGSVRFASEYGGKPLVFVGSVGVMPKKVGERDSSHKEILPGDLIVVAGGRLGKDGVHGATFSSLALEGEVPASVVQIGDPITQKRLLDFSLVARDRGWIRAITDNGAGGLSSSIGEMAQLSGGARLDLSAHAVKYPGLEYWEMLVSESQERMSYAVPPEHRDEFLQLAASMGVEAWVLGEFNASGAFELHYDGLELGRLDLEFLHHGLQPMQLRAHFGGAEPHRPYFRRHARQRIAAGASGLRPVLHAVLSAPNVASREFMVRRYDHEVQGATRLKPFTGRWQTSPNSAAVIDLGMQGGSTGNALVLAHGLCPQFSSHDTWLMAQKAVDAALRGVVAAGGNPGRVALVDNFCWPDPVAGSGNPDGAHKLGQLVRACAGLADAARRFRAPLVSGKDSMKNDFAGTTQGGHAVRISVPPTLLVTAIAQNARAERTVSAEFKQAGDAVYLIGQATRSLHGSVLEELYQVAGSTPEYPDLDANAGLYRRLYAALQDGLVASCHAVGAGGPLAAVLQCCFGNRLGVALDLGPLTLEQLFSETGSLLVASVRTEHRAAFERRLADDQRLLGATQAAFECIARYQGEPVAFELQPLQQAWLAGMKRFYDA